MARGEKGVHRALFYLVLALLIVLSESFFLPSISSRPHGMKPWKRSASSSLLRRFAGLDPKRRQRRVPRGGDDNDEEGQQDEEDGFIRRESFDEDDDREYQRVRPDVRRGPPPLRREVRRNRLPFGIPWIPQGLSAALLAGVFVLGVGTGVTVDSAINTNPKDLASRDAIDKNAPNPKICQRYGSSAMVLDQRIFVSFNPFNIFVTQADVKPGCVLRAANIGNVLEARGLLTVDEVNTCKNGSNTWAYVGDINDKPQLSCVYQSDDAQNEFLSNPKVGLGEDVYDNPGKVIKTRKPASSGSSSSTTKK